MKKEKSLKREACKYYDDIVNKRIRDYLVDKGKETSPKQAVANLAQALNITTSAVRQWRNGYVRPDVNKLPKIAQVMGCSLEYLQGVSSSKNFKNINLNKQFNLSDAGIEGLTNMRDKDLKSSNLGISKIIKKTDICYTNIISHFLSDVTFWDKLKKQSIRLVDYYLDPKSQKEYDFNNSSIIPDVSAFTLSTIIINRALEETFRQYIFKEIKNLEPNCDISLDDLK